MSVGVRDAHAPTDKDVRRTKSRALFPYSTLDTAMRAPPRLVELLKTVAPTSERFATAAVDALLADAQEAAASDLHLTPRDGGKMLEISWRLDGVLHRCADVPQAGTSLVTRLKVLAQLLTYKTEIPQEGRLRRADATEAAGLESEMRIGTFPTIHGEKAVVRLFRASGRVLSWEDLGYPPEIAAPLWGLIQRTSGLVLVTGPAGSGKTTTLYAVLRRLVTEGTNRSLCTLEDPVESVLAGVAQSQLRPSAGFDYAAGLRSLMRQDPEVVLVGEIRDAVAAEAALQLSLTGCLVLSTFHAGRAVEAISRLTDMGMEPYVLRSALCGILNQRLLRRLCDCKTSRLDEHGGTVWQAVGCDRCRQTGYRGRQLTAELLLPDQHGIATDILEKADANKLEAHARAAGFSRCLDQARALVAAGNTTVEELLRVDMG